MLSRLWIERQTFAANSQANVQTSTLLTQFELLLLISYLQTFFVLVASSSLLLGFCKIHWSPFVSNGQFIRPPLTLFFSRLAGRLVWQKAAWRWNRRMDGMVRKLISSRSPTCDLRKGTQAHYPLGQTHFSHPAPFLRIVYTVNTSTNTNTR